MTDRWNTRRWRLIRVALAGLGAVIAVGGLLAMVIAVPPVVIRASRPDIGKASAADQLKAENDLRSTLVTVLAGAAVVTGTVVAALNYNLQRRGQVTERFSKAIEQLGARGDKEREKLDIRLGGIYALEQIARDSPDLHWPIVETLTAFLRVHTWADAGAQVSSDQPDRDRDHKSHRRKVPTDIQAALTVLVRRNSDNDRGRVDLFHANLQDAELSGANLQGADLREANLQDARLTGANLKGAELGRANLQGADLSGANLQGAELGRANLQRAWLSGANLQGAELGRANLQRALLLVAKLQDARLSGANLQGADLREANLQGADGLTQQQLDSAICDEKTKPPRGLTVQLRE